MGMETDGFGPQVKLLKMNDQVRELQTILRDSDKSPRELQTATFPSWDGDASDQRSYRNHIQVIMKQFATGTAMWQGTSSRWQTCTSWGDFVFSADRLIRLVVEEGLNQLPYSDCNVTTPTGHKYEGIKFEKGNCGVSIMRSGEAMEQGLRDCCRSIRIGKILIQSDEETGRAKVYYAKFPPDIARRKVLLMYPILNTGNTVIEAIKVLIEHGVSTNHIILLSLFSTPHGMKSIVEEFPDFTVLTTEVHPVAPTHFGKKYFGTD